ncbi:hypothetical protein Holit_01654 [Hollandina sp. SP2]
MNSLDRGKVYKIISLYIMRIYPVICIVSGETYFLILQGLKNKTPPFVRLGTSIWGSLPVKIGLCVRI